MKKKININYYFLTLCFLLLTSFTIGHLQFIEENKWLFFLHSQSLIILEISFLALLLLITKRINNKKLIIGIFFFYLIGRFINYIMINLMDSSIFYVFNMIFGDGIKNIALNLEAADINNSMLIAIFFGIIIIPFIGYLIYYFLNKLSEKKSFALSKNQALKMVIVCFFLSLCFESIFYFTTNSSSKCIYKKRIPFLLNFYPSKRNEIICDKISFKIKNENKVEEFIKSQNLNAKNPKNIFLFVIESFRKDSINNIAAPDLSKFQEENIYFNYSFSTANGTHPCWFSIFYSTYPINWTEYKNKWTSGATSLKILKSLGYRIEVLSSADLKYHNMDQTIFGQNLNLIDSFMDIKYKQAWKRDATAFKKLNKKIMSLSDNYNLFIIFLDSTHSEYNLPDNFKPKFLPVKSSINYLKFAYSRSDLLCLKNKYHNVINYLDSLFSDFFLNLKKANLYDDSIIIITADHGEEFFEYGSLFHGTHLNKYQTNIPIIYKIPNKNLNDIIDINKITSQVDIFPTIIHLITGKTNFSEIFDGKSIFLNEEKKHAISSAQNGAKNSKQFIIYDEKEVTILNHIKDDKFEIIQTEDLTDNKINF